MESQPGSVPVSGTQTPNASEQQQEPDENFSCRICMEQATDGMVTPCGHIFCSSCLYVWLELKAKPCPLCNDMVELGSVIPVSGGRTRKQETVADGNIVLSLAFQDAIVTVNSFWMRETLRRLSLLRSLEQDARTQVGKHTSIMRARAAFRAIRETRPPPSIGWMAEALGSFDPSLTDSGNDAGLLLSETFAEYVFIVQREHVPNSPSFITSWEQYYRAVNPGRVDKDLYLDFLTSWCKHLHGAWDRAGRPKLAAEHRGPLTIDSDDGGFESDSEMDE